jgi:hypothetical protein
MATDQERLRIRFALDNLRQIRQRIGLVHAQLGQTIQILEDVLKLPDPAPPPTTDEG